VKELEEHISKANNRTALLRDNNFIYGTAIYVGLVPAKSNKKDQID
jgi:hypothetical protein